MVPDFPLPQTHGRMPRLKKPPSLANCAQTDPPRHPKLKGRVTPSTRLMTKVDKFLDKLPILLGGAKELGIVYINIIRGAKEPRNLQNQRGVREFHLPSSIFWRRQA